MGRSEAEDGGRRERAAFKAEMTHRERRFEIGC